MLVVLVSLDQMTTAVKWPGQQLSLGNAMAIVCSVLLVHCSHSYSSTVLTICAVASCFCTFSHFVMSHHELHAACHKFTVFIAGGKTRFGCTCTYLIKAVLPFIRGCNQYM